MRRTPIILTLLAVIGTVSSYADQDHHAAPTVPSPRLVLQLGHADALNTVAFSPDGRYVVTGSQDGAVRLWHTETGLEIRTFGQVSPDGMDLSLFGPVFSPSGKEIATGGLANHAYLWDVVTGRDLRKFSGHQDMVGAVAFSSDGDSFSGN